MNTLFLKRVDGLLGSLLARLWPRPAKPETLPSSVFRLLLIRPGGIGDAVLLVPAIRALRRAWPKAVIHVLAEDRNATVFGLCPEVDAVFRYDKVKELGAVLGGSYDVVIDTEQWHRLSAFVARLIRSSVKIGYATNERKKQFTHSVSYSHGNYEADSFFGLLLPLGIKSPGEIEIPFLEIAPSARKRAGELLEDILHRPFVVLFPGASIPERKWGKEKFQALASALSCEGIQSVVVGGRQDASVGDEIVTGTMGLNLAGLTSLGETAAVVEKSAALVSGDSGVLHIGVGLGKPTVSFFGPGIASKWAPIGSGHVVLNKNLPCSPCTIFGSTPKCPHGAKCLKEISVDEVFEAVMGLLPETGPGRIL